MADAGVTGRVNAVAPLRFDSLNVEGAIDAACTWQKKRGVKPCFKIADAVCMPRDLPQRLAARGWAPHTETLVMTAAIDAALAALPPHENVALSADYLPAMDDVLRQTSASEAEYAERSAIAQRTPQPRRFASMAEHGAISAVGLTVATGDHAAIFLMRTAPAFRRRGLARTILSALLRWAHSAGAQTAYLQVEAANAPAIALYRASAFESAYSYRYWRPQN